MYHTKFFEYQPNNVLLNNTERSQHDMNLENLKTVQDVMKIYNVSRQTVYNWRKSGWLRASICTPRCIRFSEKDLTRLEAILHE